MAIAKQSNWRLLEPDADVVRRLATALGIDALTARLLVNRGIDDIDAASRFLAPSLADLHDPMAINNMEAAVLRARRAIGRGEHILIFGDDDVDGVTATTVLFLFLRRIGARVRTFIPRRFEHGHGFTMQAIEAALAEGPTPGLMFAADCGLSGIQEIAELARRGVDTIIVDHHALPRQLPDAIILNPRLPNTRFPFIDLAAVGVAFNFVLALHQHLVGIGAFGEHSPPDLHEYLDLVSLGTVADVVPLVDENRVFVSLGVRELERRRRCGVAALVEKANSDGQIINERTICYRLAPRLNAAGRMGDANQCVNLLAADRYADAQRLAAMLEDYNELRQHAEASILEEATAIAAAQVAEGRRVLVVANEGWHQGVLGIVASRLLERFERPTLLIAINNGVARGSARSPDTLDILSCMDMCEDVIDSFGGHAVAAGLTLQAARVPELSRRIESAAIQVLAGGELPLIRMRIDGELRLKDLTLTRLEEIERLGPFGAGNPEPAFLVRGLRALRTRVVGRNHLRVKLRGDRSVVDAIGFSMGGRHLDSGYQIDVVLTPRLVFKTGATVEYQLLAVERSD